MNKPDVMDIGDSLRDGDKEYRIVSFIPNERKVNVSDFAGRTSTITLDQANDWKAALLRKGEKTSETGQRP